MNKTLLILIFAALCAGIIFAVAVQTQIPSQPSPSHNQTEPHMTPNLSCNVSSLDWGTVYLGYPVTRQVNFTNISVETVRLNMTVTNMTGAVETYSLTWNLENQTVTAGESAIAEFTLKIFTANATLTQAFSFDIIVNARPETSL